MKNILLRIALALITLPVLGLPAHAAEIFKANNAQPLDQEGSWITNSPPTPNLPGPSDLATFDSRVSTAANRTASLGSDLSWWGLRIANPGGAITLRAGNTLTLGAGGIIMTNATQNLTLSNNVTLGTSQTWETSVNRNILVWGELGGAAGVVFTKAGSNRVDLSAANSFAGNLVVNGGQVRVAHPAGLGNAQSVVVNTSSAGTAQEAGTVIAVGTNVYPTMPLTLTSSLSPDLRTTLMTAAGSSGFSGGWNGPITVVGDGSIHFNNNNANNNLTVSGNITGPAFSGTLRSRGGGSNAFLGTITIPNGSFVKHEAGPLLINAPGNQWLNTTINNGILKLGAQNALPPNTLVTFGNSGNTASLDLNGFNQQVTGLAISTDNANNVGKIYNGGFSSDSTLTYNGSGTATFPGYIDDTLASTPGFPRVNLTIASGTLNLTRPNNYSGATIIQSGAALSVMSSQGGGGSYSVGDGATLGVRVASPGVGLNVSSITLGTATGCTLDLNMGGLGNPTVAPITAGSISANGTVTINVQGFGLLEGQFPLIAYSGSIGGTGYPAFKLGPNPPGVVTAFLSNNVGSIDLVITLAAGAKQWSAAASTDWDIATSTNWINQVTTLPDAYFENPLAGDAVTFDDTSLNQNVNLATHVRPIAVTVSNGFNYTFSGPGTIYGSASLVKGGYASMTINNSNAFSGGTTLYEGTLLLGNNSALGTGTLQIPTAGAVVASASTVARSIANPLSLSADTTFGDAVNSGTLTFTGDINLNNLLRSFTFNSDTVWAGAVTNGRLNKYGPGLLTLKGVVDLNGTTEVRSGTVVLDGAAVTNTQAFRPDTDQPFGFARLVITNGTTFVLTAANANVRAGIDGNTLGTNVLDLAGLARMPGATAPDGRILLGAGSALGVVNLLPGGDAEVRSIENAGTNASEFNFNGGVLRAITNNPAFLQGLSASYVNDGGAIIDTAGWTVTIAQSLLNGGAGGLTKNGAGSLKLTGTNTYAGATAVNAGTLVLGAAHQSPGSVAVSAGATLGVEGGTVYVSGLTLAANSGIQFDFANLPNPGAPALVTGSLNPNGSVKVAVLGGAISPGVLPLIQYSGAIGGSGFAAFELDSVPRGIVATLSNHVANSTIYLHVSAVYNLLWTGAIDNNWDILTTTNWLLIANPDVYAEGDAVRFDDSASGSGTVNLATRVSPRSVTVNNSIKPYLLQGPGSIGGPAVLNKSGLGTLSLATTNTYSGSTTISEGQLKLGANHVLPDGAGKGDLVVQGTFDLAGYSDTVNGLQGSGIIENSGAAAASLSVGNNNTSSSFPGRLQNSGGPLALNKVGSGTLQLGSPNTHSGGITLSAGILQPSDVSSFGAGPLTMAGGTLALPGALTVTNLLRFTANNSRFTNHLDSGTMLFNGGVDFSGANWYVYCDSPLTLSGPLVASGGFERKFGTPNLTFKDVTGDLLGNLEIREGDVVFDNCTLTKSANGIRLMNTITNGVGRLRIINNASISLTGTGQNVRVGSASPNGEVTATNIAEIAGTVQFTGGSGSIQIGANCAYAELNLLPGGFLRIQGVTPQQTVGIVRWNFNGGTLSPIANNANFMQGLTEAYIQPGGAIIDTAGFNITIAQDLLDGGGGLTKTGLGTLLLNGANTYTGVTVVNGGSLGGIGSMAGPVTLGPDGTLSPGVGLGTLTIANSLNCNASSTVAVEIDAASSSSDLIQGLTSASYNGTLAVSVVGGVPAVGQTFQIFSAASQTGNFTRITPSPGPGTAWQFDPATGLLSVIAGVDTTPTNISWSVSGNSLDLSWPDTYLGWRLQVQTNGLNVGLTNNWQAVPGSEATNRIILPIDPANPTVFLRLTYP